MSVNLETIETFCEQVGSGDDKLWAELRDTHVPEMIAEIRSLRAATSPEYRVRSKGSGQSGRASAILGPNSYPHSRETADRALAAEIDFLRHDNVIRDDAYRRDQISRLSLETRTVTPWVAV